MYQIEIKSMDLKQIANSGQCFRMKEAELSDCWMIQSAKDYVEAKKVERGFLFSCDESAFYQKWAAYFDFDTDYDWIKSQIEAEDEYLMQAIQDGAGVRILRQDLWETIISFLISQNNNMVRIKKSVEDLCIRFGTMRSDLGFYIGKGGECLEGPKSYYTFPEPNCIFQAGIEGLSGLGLGYRDKYIYQMAKTCSTPEGEEWLQQLQEADYEKARALLMQQYGIGKKVAECICLYGLHHIEAFPIDTHINQILGKHYPNGFPMERYKGFAGVIQQYMFYYKTANGL
ncbi:MAG: N-glycosylase/DNA lyase [Clostridiales bacterium]|nr:N-glycosylase/DNA lyase [Clostridiales bacterium]